MGFSKFQRNHHFTIVMIVSGALILSLGGLFGFHTYLLATTSSTIEMAHLIVGNPFSKVRKVAKTSSDRKVRDPIRLFVGNQRNARMNRPRAPEVGNNQMKEVTNYLSNAKDAMGWNPYYWFLPCEPVGMHPACDGLNWHFRTLH